MRSIELALLWRRLSSRLSAVSQRPVTPTTAPTPGRKPVITRDDLLQAALRLIGPNRSFSTLSQREVALEAGISPNSFYRQFRDMDELAVALIDLAGSKLRLIISTARSRAEDQRSIVRVGVEVFMDQVREPDKIMHVLLRDGTTGSELFKRAVDRELNFFEGVLREELLRLAALENVEIHEPALAAKAITRLLFAMGAAAIDMPRERDPELVSQMVRMVLMIAYGARHDVLKPASLHQ
jgi:TetR/AcrR family transcriptional regulator, fatty acid biosynthesis regulator